MQPVSNIERFRSAICSQWEELLRLRRSVLKTSDPDDIHDLRVASRRLRVALGLLENISPSESAAKLKKSAGRLTRVMGGLRNIDEALLFFRSRVSPDTSADYQLFGILTEMRSLELRRIDKALKKFDPRRFDHVREISAGVQEESVPDGKKRSLPAFFSDASITLFRPIYALLTISTVPEQRESRHALRIAIKKWRYFLEIVAVVLDCDYGKELGLLKEYQAILGRMNDVAEFGVLCRELSLSKAEHELVDTILATEDDLLLQQFAELVGQKPLAYTFKVQ